MFNVFGCWLAEVAGNECYLQEAQLGMKKGPFRG